MNDRLLEAMKKLNTRLDSLENDFKNQQKTFDDYKSDQNKLNFEAMANKFERFSIKDGKWLYGGYDTGETAVGPEGKQGPKGEDGKDGKDFTFDDLTPYQIALLAGVDGEPGKDGRDGRDGIDGKDGLPGRDGKDGKDAVTPDFEIGKINSVSTYDPARVELVKKGEKYVFNMDIPRGRPGRDGIDGSNGTGGPGGSSGGTWGSITGNISDQTDLKTALNGKFDKGNVTTNRSIVPGDVYDVTYINAVLGDIESLLGGI